jgi:hypothetical protein
LLWTSIFFYNWHVDVFFMLIICLIYVFIF